ncbi:cryptochrome/photolyase family protein [Psychrobacter cryohalolentis]|uniref:Deoxyribodipyrimidine photo-lyase n=1 Tax=Psychrobacter cryohalolentis (strain ATCC BAA-1226 / DSM 17306 / VKM B-2378 / K5) TaxID=335284 RepID=Q1QDK5_PSYCK|nr:FAD-binding domain-containing protein [Psychrobacter cryohalolentis]ABE74248.1 deoxyribodipyrimidine photo-lyase type I [Psychrobacter cryohalolentis K5]ASE26880.1 deoxyribodipyrimidine photo-lyase [Psychrobacter cryohalolentis]
MSKTAVAIKNNSHNKVEDSHQFHYLMWFRRDLRVHDNTALAAICERANEDNAQLSAVFFLTPEQWQAHDMSLTQLDHIARTLPILAEKLHQLNIILTVQVCPSFTDCIVTLSALCESNNISCVMANHEYEGNEVARDELLTKQLANNEIEFIRWHDQCILPPKSITTNDDSMYQVFTPFYKKWRHTLEVSDIQIHTALAIIDNKQVNLTLSEHSANTTQDIEALCKKTVHDYQEYLQTHESYQNIDTDKQISQARLAYPAGEAEACHRLEHFIADDIDNYDVSRDVPSLQATSQLSTYLTIGAISPRLCYLQATQALGKLRRNDGDNFDSGDNNDINRWISELAWRDFYRHVLDYKPELIRHQAYKYETDKKINWSYDEDAFAAWREGKTGVPLVDAAMRCLNATGFMHNRLRMVTAMFLTKDLLIDWRWGERYFMQQLIDGDFASNNGGWQWSASTGTDSAPYFRIMNPFSQAKSHDTEGIFIKTWLPELKPIPTSILHREDKMRKALSKNGTFADIDYPVPIVEHKLARQLVIAEFKKE